MKKIRRFVDSGFVKTCDDLVKSQTLRTMLDDLGIGEDGAGDEDSEIPISNEEVTGEVFKKALIWMEKNRGKPREIFASFTHIIL